MRHLTLVALVFSLLIAVAVSGCVIREDFHHGPSLASLEIIFGHRQAQAGRIV